MFNLEYKFGSIQGLGGIESHQTPLNHLGNSVHGDKVRGTSSDVAEVIGKGGGVFAARAGDGPLRPPTPAHRRVGAVRKERRGEGTLFPDPSW